MGDDKRHAVTRMIDRLIETTVEYDITAWIASQLMNHLTPKRAACGKES